MQFSGTWRDYQARVLAELDAHLEDNRLHVVAAPGSGKTVLGLELIRRLDAPALVLAPTVAIRDQWAQRLDDLFLAAPPADQVSTDLRNPATLTLATYQALDALQRAGDLPLLASALARLGRVTLVLDEAHHLRREWWRNLELLAGTCGRIVALTATPPYDSAFAEWTRYESLCGPIDLEIGIPELVRNGDLCPHQDHVILSQPTDDLLTLLDGRHRAIAGLQQDLRADAELLDRLAAHPWLTESDAHVEAILETPEVLSAILILLHAAGRTIPRPPLALLGVARGDIPAPSFFWLEILLEALTGRLADTFRVGRDRVKLLRHRLHAEGLIEGGRVRLFQSRTVFRRMAASLSKLDSISAIARAEQAALGNGLRMVVLSDHIRAGELPLAPAADFRPAQLGVVPIFETLRRAGSGAALGMLTGTLVIIPRAALHGLPGLATDLGLAPGDFRVADLAACPDHVRLDAGGEGTAALVQLVTALFTRGDIRILVGTQSLLGEGWDAPALNSLVLASNAASYMLSNQMRGRAIRIDPAAPDKVANIWHLATLDPEAKGGFAATGEVLDWGYLQDDGFGESSEASLLARRFRAFEGIWNGNSTLIENGISRLGIYPGEEMGTTNARSFALAADRPAIARRWAASLGGSGPHARVRETVSPRHSPLRLSWYDTLHGLVLTALAGGVFAAANELRHFDGAGPLRVAAMGIAGAGFLAALPRLARALMLLWRNGSVERSLGQVGQVVLEGLHHAGLVSDWDLACGHFEIRTALDGRKDVILLDVTRNTERAVMAAIAELLSPVKNPRYLLVRRSWLGLRRRTDYHAVPAAIGAKQAWAAHFTWLWNRHVGSSRLVYTRTPAGRLALLRARARAFAAGMRGGAERRSAWL